MAGQKEAPDQGGALSGDICHYCSCTAAALPGCGWSAQRSTAQCLSSLLSTCHLAGWSLCECVEISGNSATRLFAFTRKIFKTGILDRSPAIWQGQRTPAKINGCTAGIPCLVGNKDTLICICWHTWPGFKALHCQQPPHLHSCVSLPQPCFLSTMAATGNRPDTSAAPTGKPQTHLLHSAHATQPHNVPSPHCYKELDRFKPRCTFGTGCPLPPRTAAYKPACCCWFSSCSACSCDSMGPMWPDPTVYSCPVLLPLTPEKLPPRRSSTPGLCCSAACLPTTPDDPRLPRPAAGAAATPPVPLFVRLLPVLRPVGVTAPPAAPHRGPDCRVKPR